VAKPATREERGPLGRSGLLVRGSAGPAGADPSEFAPAIKPRRFFATPSYLRLWFAGGIGNAMRWLELLVAGIFTYEATQSAPAPVRSRAAEKFGCARAIRLPD